MRQRSIALFAALVVTITVGACGSDDDEASDTTTVGQVSGPSGAGAATTVAASPAATTAATIAESSSAVTAPPGTEAADGDGVDVVTGDTTADTTAETTAETTAGTIPAAADTSPPAPPLVPEEPNPATDPALDALSTFAMDVDTGSYTYARASLQNGVVPDPAAVRTEEFVNALGQDYAAPDDRAFALTIDGTTAPFLPGDVRVVRVGIQGRTVASEDRSDVNLTFVVDISGSMADPGKLDVVRPALMTLVDSLRPSDRVGIVVYSDDTRRLLASTPVSRGDVIAYAIDQLRPEGSTNVEQGLRLGYEIAREWMDPDRIDRVILLSDGVANVGATGPGAILETIGNGARDGIDLVTIGFGMGPYNDVMMEQLADQGDGFYAYVDSEQEAERLFREDLTGTLVTIAREAKVQVEFNPAAVSSYRLIGFENRAVADDDFRDDSVDGGEVGAGHTVTALYEVTLHEGSSTADAWIARGTIRWLDPSTSDPNEMVETLLTADVADSLGESPLRLQQDVYLAAFAETLRGSGWNGLISLDGLSQNLHSLASRLDDALLDEAAGLVDIRIGLG